MIPASDVLGDWRDVLGDWRDVLGDALGEDELYFLFTGTLWVKPLLSNISASDKFSCSFNISANSCKIPN